MDLHVNISFFMRLSTEHLKNISLSFAFALSYLNNTLQWISILFVIYASSSSPSSAHSNEMLTLELLSSNLFIHAAWGQC